MLRNGRLIASGLAAAALVVAACASRPESVAGDSPRGPGDVPAGASAPVVLTGATLLTEGDSPRLLLSGTGPLAPTVYPRVDGTAIVVDLPNVVVSPGLEPPRGGSGILTQVAMKSFTELGKPHVQFELAARVPLESRMATEGGTALAVSFFAKKAEPAAAPAALDGGTTRVAAIEPEAPAVRSESVASAPAAAPAAPSAPALAPAAADGRIALVHHDAAGRAASRLGAVVAKAAKSADKATLVRISGDGAWAYDAFALSNPPRYVVDLLGVQNAGGKKQIEVGASGLVRVRVSQFRSGADPVTRVVFDLDSPVMPQVASIGRDLDVRFGGGASPVLVADASAAKVPAAGSYERHEVEETHEAVVREVPAAETTAPVTVAKAELKPEPRNGAPGASDAPVEITAAPEASASAPASSPSATSAPPAAPVVEEPKAAAPPTVVASTPEIKLSPSARSEAARKRRGPTTEDKALVEAAEALLLQQEGAQRTKDLVNPYESRTIGAGERQYTGEPVTLNLKDADVKDTLQKFSELTGLNIVLDPDVKGTVTVSLTDIPWDQALELILKINNLGYVLEGNVMRISTIGRLQQEEGARVALLKAQEQNKALKTVIQKLSYAHAGDVAGTARKIMSVRGDIFVDDRSNTLIIKELPDYLPTVLDLIRNLDSATPQVMIEARIVEATRSFLRQLGVDWGFSGVADGAHGNTTGLVFPNTGAVSGAVSLPSGTQLLKLSLANVLDTIRLDIALTAAENRGLLKIVSTPKVQTQTNQQASIQSGFQIPVQTTVNNTTSVLYIDATLRLDVTPQITAEGTVVMDIKVQKREPAIALNIALGQNIPLITRDAKTKLMVRDGGTAVIGGILKFTTQDQRGMVPGLWKVPLLGNLFRNKTEREDTDELMIFITPRIMKG